MKKIFSLFLLSGLCFSAFAQEIYRDDVYSVIKVSKDSIYGNNLPYGSSVPLDLKMDIYEPLNDTFSNRPLIILMHAGSFLPSSFQAKPGLGTKNDSCLVDMCKRYARKGFVAVSMDYRVGWNPTAGTTDERAKSIMSAVWRAQQDAKACIRFFRKNAAAHRIDPNKIVLGGSNSGAYVSIHIAHLNKPSELSIPKLLDGNNLPYIDTVALGGFEGISGNPGYPSMPNLTLNLGGAIADTSLIEAGEIPMISLHGVSDAGTPYNTAVVIVSATGQPGIEVSGSHDFTRRATNLGIQNVFLPEFAGDSPFPALYPFYGVGFEPYGMYNNSTAGARDTASKYIDTVLTFSVPRIIKALNITTPNVVAKDQVQFLKNSIQLYPNPTQAWFRIRTENQVVVQTLNILDLNGKVVYSELVNGTEAQIQTTGFIPGLYFVELETNKGKVTQKLQIQ